MPQIGRAHGGDPPVFVVRTVRAVVERVLLLKMPYSGDETGLNGEISAELELML